MNYLGKSLVLVNLLLSVFFLAWAAAVYTQRVDWGWKDPRKTVSAELVPSEIDKRQALVKELLPVAVRADQRLDDEKKRQGLITEAIGWGKVLVANHEWYNKELARLQSAPGKIEIKQVQVDKGQVVLEPPMYRPVLDKKVTYTDADKKTTDVDKSFDSYRIDLRKVRDSIDTVMVGIQKWVEKQKDLTARLNGAGDDAGKPGLYTLLQRETEAQEEIKKEISYLRPMWVRELVDAQLLLERQDGLRARLTELKAVKAARR
jgi:hypothetical protein